MIQLLLLYFQFDHEQHEASVSHRHVETVVRVTMLEVPLNVYVKLDTKDYTVKVSTYHIITI